VANQTKRNDILLKHILSKAQSQLRLGLDLKGGVGVTLMIDEAAQDGLNEFEQRNSYKMPSKLWHSASTAWVWLSR
jgi:SecD/SecF fusion protein